jgi:hypothetical protein
VTYLESHTSKQQRKKMKGQWKKGWQMAGILLAAAMISQAQTATARPSAQISMASPGTVNYIEGDVSVAGQPLSAQYARSTVVAPNQVIDTSNGYVEVLLTPGAFLRIGHNSEVQLVSAGLTGVNLQLNHGSAMIEAADLVKGSQIQVVMNGATTRIEQKGLYDFDTNQQAVSVLDGKAQVLESAGSVTLKKGDRLSLTAGGPLKKHDFDMKSARAEPLYVWSKVRSENESEANVRVADRLAAGGGWYGPGWYWDPFWSGYAFVPAWGFLGSPFGWGYYSPGFVYSAPLRYGYYGHAFHGNVGGVRTGVRSFHR